MEFILLHIFILICYLGTLLLLEFLINKNLHSKILKAVVIIVYFISFIIIIFNTQLLKFFEEAGSIQISGVITSSQIFIFIFFVHVIIFYLIRSNDRSPSPYTNQSTTLFCGNCGYSNQNMDYCGKYGYKI
ncbi:MAG: hypothetical protein HeimC3_35830 [Candidatus Heimdallarchaeota archaeon LC_3]|nr:MAG: hypothetical protein HeimC3_35830 [Candidatus Heimdallarchaeota archaeon LC_3]